MTHCYFLLQGCLFLLGRYYPPDPTSSPTIAPPLRCFVLFYLGCSRRVPSSLDLLLLRTNYHHSFPSLRNSWCTCITHRLTLIDYFHRIQYLAFICSHYNLEYTRWRSLSSLSDAEVVFDHAEKVDKVIGRDRGGRTPTIPTPRNHSLSLPSSSQRPALAISPSSLYRSSCHRHPGVRTRPQVPGLALQSC